MPNTKPVDKNRVLHDHRNHLACWDSNRRPFPLSGHRSAAAYTLAEVMVSVLLLGLLTVSLFSAFSSGMALVQSARENLRATQILSQKMESLRVLTWDQGLNPLLANPTFTEWYVPNNPNTLAYQGVVTATGAPAGTPADYANDLRVVTVALYWTNNAQGLADPIVHSRQMQTCVARNGMQNYLYP